MVNETDTTEETLVLEPNLIRTSYSALTAHRECASRWTYRYVLKIKKPDFGPKPELHFGSWWGALTAAEGLERGRKLGSLVSLPAKIQGPDDSPEFDAKTVTKREIMEAAVDWWKTRDGETKAAWEEKLGEGLPKRLMNLYKRWMDTYAEERKNERPLGYEVKVQRVLARPTTGEWASAELEDLEGVSLLGYLDEVYLDVARNLVVIRDRKSHKALKPHTSLSDMMDSQLPLYAWVGGPLIESWGLGKVGATGYDRARSVKPKQPEVTKTAGTLSKSVTDYDLSTYLAWAEGPDGLGVPWGEDGKYVLTGNNKGKAKFGIYTAEEKIIENLSTPQAQSIWFQRTRVPLNRNVVAAHLQAALDTAADAWRTKKRMEATGEAGRSLGKACDWCDYAEICRDRMMGGALGEYPLEDYGLTAPDGAKFLINGKLEKEMV